MEAKNLLIGGKTVYSPTLASLDVDPQCGFSNICPDELPVPGAQEIVSELNAQAEYIDVRTASRDAHPAKPIWLATDEEPQFSPIEGYRNLDIRWKLHCVSGTLGFEFLPGLDIRDYQFIAYKGIEADMHPYGACYRDLDDKYSTGLLEFFRANQIENIIVGGLATSYCVKKTVLQLCQYGCFNVFVNLAACRDILGSDTEASIREMKEAGAIMIANSKEIKVIE